MDCNEVLEKLSCYLDKVLDEASYEAVESHLTNCPDCRFELEALRVLTEAASEVEEIEPPVYLKAAIKRSVRSVEKESGCVEVLAMLSEYLDEELPESKIVLVEQHTEKCVHCARELEMLKRTVSAVSSLAEVLPPAELREKIAAATVMSVKTTLSGLVQRTVEKLWPRTIGWAAAGTAAAAAVIGLMSLNGPQMNQHTVAVKPVPKKSVKPAPAPEVIALEPEKAASPEPEKMIQKAAAAPRAPQEVEETRKPEEVRVAAEPDTSSQIPPVEAAPETKVATSDQQAHKVTAKPEVKVAKLAEQDKPVEAPKVEKAAEPEIIDAAKIVAELESNAANAKHEEQTPSLIKIAVAPRNPARDLNDWARSMKQEMETKRKFRDSSTLRLFDTKF